MIHVDRQQSFAMLFLMVAVILLVPVATTGRAADPETLANTKPLTVTGDIASQMVDGIDRFLLRELERSIADRARHWKRDISSAIAYNASIEPNRNRLAHILGVRDERVTFANPELIATTAQPALVAKGQGFDIYAIRWPSIGDMHGEGLMLVPSNGKSVADIVAIPDAGQTPEQLVGLSAGVPVASQFPRRLAAAGCRVIVPSLISRDMQRRAPPGRGGRANLTHREFVYRAAFEMGRHLIGYELQKILACVDWFSSEGALPRTIGVIGYGEGGMLALYAGALDPRIDGVCVSGHFGSRQECWNEPLDRNVFGLLEQFGDAEIASMLATRVLVIDSTPGPDVTLPSEGGGPAAMRWHTPQAIAAERQRLFDLVGDLKLDSKEPAVSKFSVNVEPATAFCNVATLQSFFSLLELDQVRIPAKDVPLKEISGTFDTDARLTRQIREMDDHSQWLLRESPFVRREFMKELDTSSLEKYAASVENYRDFFRHEVIGHFDQPLLPADPRSRKTYDEEKWTGYEVILNVFPDVFAQGILCLPKDLKPNEKRPVVVCQHGLEGRPTDIVTGDRRAYHDFASKLAERGFITFAPQNIYIFKDRFRTLQRKANPLKKTLFSIMVPQHQQIVNWLKTLPNVDPDRIAFYGLSYGGKSAMRIPPLVTDYCLSICSADFNEWVLKNASTRHNFSYMWTGEYEIFEWDLGSTFNYAEMAYLICPRPFMVERGHFDGVGEDEWVGYEYAKIRHMYAAKLFIPERTEIEWFYGKYKGVHTINGQGTYKFLHKHLDWPRTND